MTSTIDVRRLIRIATVLLCIVAACLVYFAYTPDVDAAALRVDQAELQLDSDRSTFFHIGALRRERSALSDRYGRLFAQNPEAVFLRGLSADVSRHGVTLVSTSEARDPAPPGPGTPADGSSVATGDRTVLNVELRGGYRNVLAAIGELSLGAEIVRVDPPTLRRDGSEVSALVPVTIFEPATHAGPNGTP